MKYVYVVDLNFPYEGSTCYGVYSSWRKAQLRVFDRWPQCRQIEPVPFPNGQGLNWELGYDYVTVTQYIINKDEEGL